MPPLAMFVPLPQSGGACGRKIIWTYVTLVILGVEVLTIPTGWEEDLGTDSQARLLRQVVGLRGGAIFQTHVRDGELFHAGFIECSGRRITK